MFKLVIILCLAGGNCLPYTETPVKFYSSLEECEIAGRNKAEAMKEDAIDSQLPLAYIEGVCIQTDIDSV